MATPNPRTILVPVDFSECSGRALRQAALVARCAESKVVAAYANWFEAPPYFTESRLTELQNEFRQSIGQAQRMLEEFVTATLESDTGIVESRVVEALPVDGIRQVAESLSPGLIVMGTHGRTGWNRWTLGSVTERVLREIPIPVLTVREGPVRPFRNILAAVDASEASRTALAAAIDLGACFEATVTVVHVHESHGSGRIANLCEWVGAEHRARCIVRELVRHGDAAAEIVRLASEEAYDLLVLGAPRRRFFEGMVLGTTTIRAVRHAPCPVLSVPEGRPVPG